VEGAKETYRAEWHPGDHARFLGSERFIKKIVKEKTPLPVSRLLSLENFLQKVASRAGLDQQSLKRKGLMARWLYWCWCLVLVRSGMELILRDRGGRESHAVEGLPSSRK
jgi:hypothetical protein